MQPGGHKGMDLGLRVRLWGPGPTSASYQQDRGKSLEFFPWRGGPNETHHGSDARPPPPVYAVPVLMWSRDSWAEHVVGATPGWGGRTLNAGFSWHLHSLFGRIPSCFTMNSQGAMRTSSRLSEERTKAGWHHSGRMRAKYEGYDPPCLKKCKVPYWWSAAFKVQTNTFMIMRLRGGSVLTF